MLCLLNTLDNPQRDIYLAGFMRSVVGTFTDDELAIIKQKNTLIFILECAYFAIF